MVTPPLEVLVSQCLIFIVIKKGKVYSATLQMKNRGSGEAGTKIQVFRPLARPERLLMAQSPEIIPCLGATVLLHI